jgi:hypothetical protein
MAQSEILSWTFPGQAKHFRTTPRIVNHCTLQEQVTVIGNNILKQNVHPETGCMKKFLNKPDTNCVLSVTVIFFCKMSDQLGIMRL